MYTKRSLRLPILLAIGMIVLLVALTVGWVLLSVFGAMGDDQKAGVYWALLTIGTVFLLLVLVGVVIYLLLSIKAINLTQRQSNFIDSVTHELKSPIASLKLYLQTLNRRQVSAEEQADFYRFMLEDVERLDQLITHLLEAGRLERSTGNEAAEREDVDLGELLALCAQTVCVRHRVPVETVRFNLQPLQLHARRVDLEMIFRNLLDNAVKYGGSEPQVEVTAHVLKDGRAVIRIADNGSGIPYKLRRKIFGRFVRLGHELTREKPGTGLGLYIVRTLVTRLKGQIRIRDREGDSQPGTIFEVVLPGATTISTPGSSQVAADQPVRHKAAAEAETT